MENSQILPDEGGLLLSDYVKPSQDGRENLGADVPVAVYRLLEYSMREELAQRLGQEEQIEIFRGAGFRAGTFFARHYLDLTLDFSGFTAQLQRRLEELKIGVLRLESAEEDTGRIFLTMSEDADCSGLPMLGRTVCNYDEGFLAGVLTAYTGRDYTAVEVTPATGCAASRRTYRTRKGKGPRWICKTTKTANRGRCPSPAARWALRRAAGS